MAFAWPWANLPPMRIHFQRLLLAGFLSVAGLATASDALLNRLEPKGIVNDFANIIPADYERRIEAVIVELKQKTGAEIAVVTLQSLEGGNIDDFTNRLFERWGIGQKGKDNGLMFLCAMQDRKMRIEVGYGLEGEISDSRAGIIRRDVITPHFKAGNPQAGILKGVESFATIIANPNKAVQPAANHGADFDWDWVWILVPFFGFIGFCFYSQIKHGNQPQRRGRYTWNGNYGSTTHDRWGAGGGFGGFSGGGGFGGFGGGMSGGGGSSGGW